MKRLRWLSWLMAGLLVAAYVTTGAHVHHTGIAGHDDSTQHCVACTMAHAPVAAPDAVPAVRAPERTREMVQASPLESTSESVRAIHGSRAPPLG